MGKENRVQDRSLRNPTGDTSYLVWAIAQMNLKEPDSMGRGQWLSVCGWGFPLIPLWTDGEHMGKISNRAADFSCCVSVLLNYSFILWLAVKLFKPNQLCLWPPTRLPIRNNIGIICPELIDLETPFLPSVFWLWLLPSIHTQLAWLFAHTTH